MPEIETCKKVNVVAMSGRNVSACGAVDDVDTLEILKVGFR